MKYKVMLLLGLSGIVVSCEKITNVKLLEPASTGKLSYKIVDDSGRGLTGVKVSLFENRGITTSYYLDPTALKDTLRTNQDGVAVFSNLFPDNYLIVTDSPRVNNIKYNTREFVQVIAGIEKKKVTVASEFSGSLKITLRSMYDFRTPLKNMGVAAVPYSPNKNLTDNISAVIDAAAITGITDENGFVSLKIPSNINYYLLVYSLDRSAFTFYYENYLILKDANIPVLLYRSPVIQ